MENHLLLNHPFWKFSLDLYRHADVEKACLFLQDTYDFNVNLILFIVWNAKNNRGAVSKEQLKALLNKMFLWNEFVTKPIRQEREQPVDEYAQWLKVELIAESIEQWLLLKSFENATISKKTTPQDQINYIWQSLENYAVVKEVKLTEQATKHVTALINRAFPNK